MYSAFIPSRLCYCQNIRLITHTKQRLVLESRSKIKNKKGSNLCNLQALTRKKWTHQYIDTGNLLMSHDAKHLCKLDHVTIPRFSANPPQQFTPTNGRVKTQYDTQHEKTLFIYLSKIKVLYGKTDQISNIWDDTCSFKWNGQHGPNPRPPFALRLMHSSHYLLIQQHSPKHVRIGCV